MLIGYRCWQMTEDNSLTSIIADFKWDGPNVYSGDSIKPELDEHDLDQQEIGRHHPQLGIMSYKYPDILLENEEDVQGGILGVIHPYGVVSKHLEDETGDAGYRSEYAQILGICGWAKCDYGWYDGHYIPCENDAAIYNGALWECIDHYDSHLVEQNYAFKNNEHKLAEVIFKNIASKYGADLLSFQEFVNLEENRYVHVW